MLWSLSPLSRGSNFTWLLASMVVWMAITSCLWTRSKNPHSLLWLEKSSRLLSIPMVMKSSWHLRWTSMLSHPVPFSNLVMWFGHTIVTLQCKMVNTGEFWLKTNMMNRAWSNWRSLHVLQEVTWTQPMLVSSNIPMSLTAGAMEEDTFMRLRPVTWITLCRCPLRMYSQGMVTRTLTSRPPLGTTFVTSAFFLPKMDLGPWWPMACWTATSTPGPLKLIQWHLQVSKKQYGPLGRMCLIRLDFLWSDPTQMKGLMPMSSLNLRRPINKMKWQSQF